MVKVLNYYEGVLILLASSLDRARSNFLSSTMRHKLLRTLYTTRAWRLGAIFLFATLLYLPLALSYPAFLLIAGPLVFGYAHLIASYRFTREGEDKRLLGRFTDTQTLLFITVGGVGSRLLCEYFGFSPKWPFGFWEIVFVSASVTALACVSRIASVERWCLSLVVSGVLLFCAWHEPILFLGGTLIAHNWIAFLYWFAAARVAREKIVCAACALVFGALHFAIYFGFADIWMPEAVLHGAMPMAVRSVGWYLASWTSDPLVWYRLVVIYTFGLSIHYFIWLKAIPESGMTHENPNPFRVSLEKLREDTGDRTLIFVLLVALVTLGVYAVSTVWGARVYFAAAAMHGWFEVSFLTLRSRRL